MVITLPGTTANAVSYETTKACFHAVGETKPLLKCGARFLILRSQKLKLEIRVGHDKQETGWFVFL